MTLPLWIAPLAVSLVLPLACLMYLGRDRGPRDQYDFTGMFEAIGALFVWVAGTLTAWLIYAIAV